MKSKIDKRTNKYLTPEQIEARNKRQRDYKKNNPEQAQKNRDRVLKWQKEHPAMANATAREWASRNKDVVNAKRRAKYAKEKKLGK